MCGILFYEGNIINEMVDGTQPRGPDNTNVKYLPNGGTIVFHRLKIRGDDSFMQPQPIKSVSGYSAINGEIYGTIDEEGDEDAQRMDCEYINHLFTKEIQRIQNTKHKTHKEKQQLTLDEEQKALHYSLCDINGEYAGLIVTGLSGKHKEVRVHVFRDPTGVRGLIAGYTPDEKLVVSSTMVPGLKRAWSVEPNQIWSWSIKDLYTFGPRKSGVIYPLYVSPYLATEKTLANPMFRNMVLNSVRESFIKAVKKRYYLRNKEVGVGAFLSGGMDSSLIVAVIQKILCPKEPLRTFSIGLKGSPDLEAAREVAENLGTIHTSVEFTPDEAIRSISQVIKALGSCDITTVRASIPHYLCSKYIRTYHPDIKIMFTGELADEASGSYTYFGNAPDLNSFDQERERLLKEVHMFDNLRSDRCISAWGLEARVPFADTCFLKKYLQLPSSELFWGSHCKNPTERIEKSFLREAFGDIIPEPARSRRKNGMSNGCSPAALDLSIWLKGQGEKEITEYELYKFKNALFHRGVVSKEAALYMKYLVLSFGVGSISATPKYWMPKWTDTDDPSARSLFTYKGD